jgi:hydrogenase nickel incorporation protein HypA/HybF
MHELALTQNLLEVALGNAAGKKIVHVNLTIGEFSDEREEAIRFYWDDLAKDTPAAHAQLFFRRVDAEMECLACGAVFHPDDEAALCPSCLSHRLKLIRGDDVRLESIDVE